MNPHAYDAAHNSAALRPLSHFGRFHVAGRDAATLLHHLTTNDIKNLRVGHGNEAALISSRARLLDWLSIYRTSEGFQVITSPNRRDLFAPHARRFILYKQDVEIHDITDQGAMFALIGPTSSAVLCALFDIESPPEIGHCHEIDCDGVLIRIARTPRLPNAGMWIWSNDAARLQSIVSQSALPVLDDATYNVLRVESGIPATGLELTDEINPWEARLDASISLAKGCYNGQEIIARLNTYQKIKQRLCGLSLSSPLPMGTRAELRDETRVAGWISSSVDSPRFGPIALGYVRGDWQTLASALKVPQDGAEIDAIVCELPFGATA